VKGRQGVSDRNPSKEISGFIFQAEDVALNAGHVAPRGGTGRGPKKSWRKLWGFSSTSTHGGRTRVL